MVSASRQYEDGEEHISISLDQIVTIELEIKVDADDSDLNPAVETSKLSAARKPSTETDEIQRLSTSTKRWQTFFVASLCFAMGLSRSQEGVAFLDLLLIVQSNIEQGTIIQTMASFGYLIGCLVAGVALSKIDNDWLSFAGVSLGGVLSIVIPFCSLLPVMAMVIFLRDGCLGFLVSTAICVCSNLWGAKAGPYIHTILFMAAVGGVVSPFITEPFLLPRDTGERQTSNSTYNTPLNRTCVEYDVERAGSQINKTDAKTSTVRCSFGGDGNFTYSVGVDQENGTEAKTKRNDDFSDSQTSQTRVHWAFIIFGLFSVFTSLPFLINYIRKPKRQKDAHTVYKERSKERRALCSNLGRVSWLTSLKFSLIFFTFFLYGSLEKGCSIFMMPFVVTYLDWTKANASYVLGGFWLGFAAGRLLGIFQARYCSAGRILLLDILLVSGGLVALMFGSWGHSAATWVASVILGLGTGPMYAALLCWISVNVTRLSGKVTAFCTASFSLGIMAGLSLLGYLFEHFTSLWFLYLNAATTGALFGIFVLLYVIFVLCKSK